MAFMYLVTLIALFKNRHVGAFDNEVIRGDFTQTFEGNEKWLHLTHCFLSDTMSHINNVIFLGLT